MRSPVYMGIDVACAARKRLPVCVVSKGLQPLPIPKELADRIPRGLGNREITSSIPFQQVAAEVANTILRIADKEGWEIQCVAIDAPAASPAIGPRLSEVELGRRGLSSFRTPAAAEWAAIKTKCVEHMQSGGLPARLPHANKIWMRFGFELFSSLRRVLNAAVIEVYPFAIVRTLLPECAHKSTDDGYRAQLAAIAARTGCEPFALESALKATVPGSRHDRLDAFMAAWIASLPPDQRQAIGDTHNPDDAIWVPL